MSFPPGLLPPDEANIVVTDKKGNVIQSPVGSDSKSANAPNKKKPSNKIESYRYPYKKLLDNDDYLKISIMDYKPPGFASGFVQPTADTQYGNSKTKVIILLPIPQSVSSSNSTSWNGDTMGPLEVAALGAAGTIIEGGGLSGLKEVAGQAAAALTGSSLAQKAGQAVLAQKAVSGLFGNESGGAGVLGRTTGAVFNQNIELLFQGVSLREPFSLGYDLTPRNKKESDEIKNIIRVFKKQMSGRKGGQGAGQGIFIKSPSVFRLEYKSGKINHPYLNRFKICALTSMSVDFTGSGTYATYSDGTPVHLKLGLGFQELTPIYAEDYDTEEGKLGTGY